MGLRLKVITLSLLLYSATTFAQQTVGQGPPGESTEPWFVTGNITFGSPQHVICDSGCTPGGSFLDNATFTVGATAFQPIGGPRLDAPADVADGNAAAARITPKRALHVNQRDNSGNNLITNHNASPSSASLPSLLIGGADASAGVQYAIPVLSNNFAASNTNTFAIPVDIRSATEVDGNAKQRNEFISVGGIGNESGVPGAASKLIFSDGNTKTSNPVNTWGLVSREYGQSFAVSGNVSIVGQRASVSSRFVAKSATIFKLVDSTFVGTLKPVVSFDNGTTWDFVSAINAVTGVTVTQLVDGAVSGVFVNPFCAGSTDCGFEITARTGGSVSWFVTSNTTGTNGIFASVTNNGIFPVQATVASLPLPTGAATETTLSSLDSKFPTAGVIGDSFTNPNNVTRIQNFPMLWNGVSWDRAPGDADGGALIKTGALISSPVLSSAPVFPLGGINGASWDVPNVNTFEPAPDAAGLIVRQVGMPEPAFLTDNTTNPFLTKLQTFTMVWDGSTWDRWTGAVTAINLDTRDLVFASDKVDVSGSTVAPDRFADVVVNTVVEAPATNADAIITDLNGVSALTVTLINTGSHVGTQSYTFSVSANGGTTWSSIFCHVPSVATWVASSTFTGTTQINSCQVSGYEQFRVRFNGGTSGSFTVYLRGSTGSQLPRQRTSLANGNGDTIAGLDDVPSASSFGLVTRQVGLPAAATLTDNTANPSATKIQTFPMKWDGANWDRFDGVVKELRAATPAVTSVNDTNVSTTCLASNTSRLEAVLYNDSTADLMVKYGATASATSFTYKLFPDQSLTVHAYTGVIDCIWTADSTGAARVTEVTQ